jgi:hypothetical protein
MKKTKKWKAPLVENSKKVKLPKFIDTGKKDKKGKPIMKKLWVKDKSKFLHIRLHDEGKTSINQLI